MQGIKFNNFQGICPIRFPVKINKNKAIKIGVCLLPSSPISLVKLVNIFTIPSKTACNFPGTSLIFPTAIKVKSIIIVLDGRTYHNTKIEVSADGTNWTTLFDSAVSGEYAETSAGHTVDVDKAMNASIGFTSHAS